MERNSLRGLIQRYNELLKLYEQLEAISKDVYSIIQAGSRVSELTPKLKENAMVAERISEESQVIVAMKKDIMDMNVLSESDRQLLRDTEKNLSEAVNRVVEQEDKSRAFIMKQGVKISRR